MLNILLTEETSPEEDPTVSSASLCMSPSVNADADRSAAPLCSSTPFAPRITNGYDAVDNRDRRRVDSCDTINGNVNVHIVSESPSMDVLSGGESDAGDTLSRRNNNTISSRTVYPSEAQRRRGDVTYFVAKELLMTERTYKRDLELVTVTWSRLVGRVGLAASSSAEGAEASALARGCLALEPLALPAGKLLARLDRALATHPTHELRPSLECLLTTFLPPLYDDNEEPEYKKVADLLYEYLTNIYDAYSQYALGAGGLVALVESARRRGGEGARAAALFDASAPLPLAALLLRPLHRALHLRRLAHELVAGAGAGGGAEGGRARDVLELASGMAALALQQLPHVENHATLCQLQRDLAGYDKLLVAEREFIRLGCLYKHSSKGLQQRMLFLFSDMLLIASKGSGAQFRAQMVLPLHSLQLMPSDLPNSFTLTSAGAGEETCVLRSGSNEHEYAGWFDALAAAISAARRRPAHLHTHLTDPDHNNDHGSEWCSGESAGGTNASACAAGGQTASAGSALTLVCWHRVASLTRTHLNLAIRTQLSGYLLRKFKNSHGWQKLWVVFAVFTLFFYKSWQDETPLASLPLLGYNVGSPAPNDGIDKDFVFKLQYKNHVYFFRADSHFTYSRWIEVLQTPMLH
ncbi:unnamed protein product [Parnassius apollo]|uniref:(apollo) hypothetical protein n=1 Tax=Parnassius apollo TaxID=110799 RepID=A0A8S3XIH4_PARAO|nr:unnamed protein product [Parnassius apollo]